MKAYKMDYCSCPTGTTPASFNFEVPFKLQDLFENEKHIDTCIDRVCRKSKHLSYNVQKRIEDDGSIDVYVEEILDGTPFTIINGREVFEDEKDLYKHCVWEQNFWNMLADIYEHPEKDYYLSEKDFDEKIGHNLEHERDLRVAHWRVTCNGGLPEKERLSDAETFRQIAKDKLTFNGIAPGTKTSFMQVHFKKVNIDNNF